MQITIGKTGTTREVDFDAFAPNVRDYVIQYGLTQILNDAHSSVTATSEPDETKRHAAVEAMVDKKLAAMSAGKVQARVGGVRDPVKSRAIKIAMGLGKAIKGPDGKPDGKAMRAAAIKMVEKYAFITERAKQQIADEAALGDLIIDDESPDADE